MSQYGIDVLGRRSFTEFLLLLSSVVLRVTPRWILVLVLVFRARDRSGILLSGVPGKRYKRIARFPVRSARNAP
jgi:hypothetical protein